MRFVNLALAAALLTAGALTNAHAGPVTLPFSDDFEGYADTDAMNDTWTNGGTATLDTAFGNPGQSMHHPGTEGAAGENTNLVTFPNINPAGGQFVRFSADIFDDASSANKRVSAGIRSGANNIIEMGMFNSPAHYAVRVILFDSGDVNWVAFSDIVDDAGEGIANAPVEGWHRYSVDVTEDSATFTLDLGSTGIINATEVVAPLSLRPQGFSELRLGGPSDLWSAGGGANFDNVSIAVIPEPSSLALLALGLVAAVGVRRRRVA